MLTKTEIDFYSSAHHPYYIAAPAYRHTSAGIRALHYLCHILNEAGYEAYVTTDVTSPYLRTPLLTNEVRKRHTVADRLPIVVYPEVVVGNPLKAQVIARWLLNIPGHLGGDSSFPDSELLFFWDTWVLTDQIQAERLYFPLVDSRIFNNLNNPHDANREGICYYANKYFRFGGTVTPYLKNNGISLCQDIPRAPEEIAAILRRCKVFYCYEPSTLVREAQACGCQIIYVSTPYFESLNNAHGFELCISEDQIEDTPAPKFDASNFQKFIDTERIDSWRLVDNFIKVTQATARNNSTPEKKYQQIFDRGLQAYQDADYSNAMELFSSLLEKIPDAPLPYAYLAFICATQSLNAEADDFISQAEALAPGRHDFRAALGEVFLKSGNANSAAHYLNSAICAQPDLFHAYPALAESMRQTGQTEAAIALLRSTAGIVSDAQETIRAQLLEVLATQGNLEEYSKTCLAFAKGPDDYSLAIRSLAHIDIDPSRLITAIDLLRKNLLVASTSDTTKITSAPLNRNKDQLTIAFLVSNFQRESKLSRLEVLLDNLPPEQFFTLVIDNDPLAEYCESAQHCTLVADRWLTINGQSDDDVLRLLAKLSPDILIDLDGYDTAQRLTLFSAADVACKLSWGDLPLPPSANSSHLLTGKALLNKSKCDSAEKYGLAPLSGMGEIYQLPAVPLNKRPLQQLRNNTFGCLTPSKYICQESWQLFAKLLVQNPEANLTINLAELGSPASEYIKGVFSTFGVSPERLDFIHACDKESLCHHWLSIKVGLAPLHGNGDQALPTGLWMNRPYVVLDSENLWSRRPAALLETLGCQEWIARNREEYLVIAQRIADNECNHEEETLRERILSANLCDAAGFAKDFVHTLHKVIRERNQ